VITIIQTKTVEIYKKELKITEKVIEAIYKHTKKTVTTVVEKSSSFIVKVILDYYFSLY